MGATRRQQTSVTYFMRCCEAACPPAHLISAETDVIPLKTPLSLMHASSIYSLLASLFDPDLKVLIVIAEILMAAQRAVLDQQQELPLY